MMNVVVVVVVVDDDTSVCVLETIRWDLINKCRNVTACCVFLKPPLHFYVMLSSLKYPSNNNKKSI